MGVQNFTHRMAAHCESGTVTSLLNHAGLEITEPMVFGISGAIFFGYIKHKQFNFPTFIVRNKPGLIRKNIGKQLGAQWETFQFKNPQKGTDKLHQLLDEGKAVASQVDFFYMDYMPEWQRVHINVHFIIITNYDQDSYTVSDSYFPKITRLSKSNMDKARFAGGFMAPKGFLYYLKDTPSQTDLRKPIVFGIKKACFNMLKLPVPFVGVKGIYRFADKIPGWPTLTNDTEYLSDQVMRINVLLEDQGTGGGGFRFMYATFLQQAAEILQSEKLSALGDQMMSIGDGWRELALMAARTGKERNFTADKMTQLSKKLREQGDREKDFFTQLQASLSSLKIK